MILQWIKNFCRNPFLTIIHTLGALLQWIGTFRDFDEEANLEPENVQEVLGMSEASPSNAPRNDKKYDVFISFRGEDTRKNFVSHLHAALCRSKIKTFIDEDDLKKGDEISPALLNAIEDSKISVIIFSKNYASSSWCLDELSHILRCKQRDNQIVMPVFYCIDPSDIRHQRESYADAFAKHGKRFKDNIEKVKQWRHALTTVAGISGRHSSITDLSKSDEKLVEEIRDDIWERLNTFISPRDQESSYLIGIEERIEKVESLLNMSSLDVRVVGLWGMGGIGKTTLAEAVYKQIKNQFDGACFFRNVREESKKQGLVCIQQALFSELLKEKSVNIGDSFVKVRLCRTKVLIVLDDVDDVDQLKCLALDQLESLTRYRNWFGDGSRIIVTSRDKNVLDNIGDHETYKVEKLDSSEARQLFCSKAFQENSSTKEHAELSERVVNYADGIPLALTVLGCHLLHKNSEEWESELDLLRKSPNDKVYNALKISYDGLNENARNVFLDVAHFFKGEDPDFVKGILKANGLVPAAAIRVLIDRSLLTIMDNKFWMHDLVQQMGFKIVHEESKEPGKRSRLCSTEDVYCVLRGNTGTGNILGIQMNMSELKEDEDEDEYEDEDEDEHEYEYEDEDEDEDKEEDEDEYEDEDEDEDEYEDEDEDEYEYEDEDTDEDECLNPLIFKKMPNLRLLKVIQPSGCTKTLNFSQGLESLPDELRYLSWDYYPLKSLPSDFKMGNLVELHLRKSQLEHLCLGVQHFRSLKVLNLERSRNLTQIPHLTKAPILEKIKLKDCKRVVNLPRINGMLDLLQSLDLSGCSRVDKFPELPMNIKELNMSGTKIRQVPSTIEHLSLLERFILKGCRELETLPTSIHKLKSLRCLDLHNCIQFKYLPKILEPPFSTDLLLLEILYLRNTRISEFPDWIIRLPSLVGLDISETSIRTIPASIKDSKLGLCIEDCEFLQNLPELPASNTYVDAKGCTSLEKLTISSIELAPQPRDRDRHFDYERLIFDDCLKLDRNNIMNEFVSRAVRMANQLAKGIRVRRDDEPPQVVISFLGNEIPGWFSHKEEGCFISMKRSPHWYNTNFTGFAACLIVGWADNSDSTRGHAIMLKCKMFVKTINGETCFNHASGFCHVGKDRSSHHVFLWYLHAHDLDSSAEEIFFHFKTAHLFLPKSSYDVKKCGIRMLSLQDAEGLRTTDLDVSEPLSMKPKL